MEISIITLKAPVPLIISPIPQCPRVQKSSYEIHQYDDDTEVLSLHINYSSALHMLQIHIIQVMKWYTSKRIHANLA